MPAATTRRLEVEVRLARGRAFPVRRGDHRRRRGDARVRHPHRPRRARGDLAPGRARGPLGHGDGQLPRPDRRRARCAEDRRGAGLQGACCSSAAPRPTPSPSSRSSPTTSSAPTAPRSARWTRWRGYYMAARGIPPEAARKLLVRAFIADAFVALEDDGERERAARRRARRAGGRGMSTAAPPSTAREPDLQGRLPRPASTPTARRGTTSIPPPPRRSRRR